MATTDVHDDEWDDPVRAPVLRVLVHSDDAGTRDAVTMAVGRRVAKDLPPVEWVPVATAETVLREVTAGGLDLLILDGEASRNGGIGLCRQLKDEVYRCPPVLVLIGRPQDAWLASWSQADAVVARPLDPVVVQDAVAGLLRSTRVGR